jgi:pimeloyl-ACP methyl ester carboxylesterase
MGPTLPYIPGVHHREVVVDGLRLHVAFAGPAQGPAVVLQHGWPQNWYEWRHLIPPLANAGYRVIAPDFRGFGWSEHPADEDFLKETLVDDIVALCAELGHQRIAYVGHDWGCWVGWLLCLRRPDLVDRAMLISVRPPFPPETITRSDLARLGSLWYQLVISAPAPHAAKAAFVRAFLEPLRRSGVDEGDLAAYRDPLTQPAQVRASKLLYRQFVTRELPRLIAGRYGGGKRLVMPVRFIVGEKDPLYYDGIVDEARPHADDYAGESLPGAGHFVPEEVPDLVRDRVMGLLTQGR